MSSRTSPKKKAKSASPTMRRKSASPKKSCEMSCKKPSPCKPKCRKPCPKMCPGYRPCLTYSDCEKDRGIPTYRALTHAITGYGDPVYAKANEKVCPKKPCKKVSPCKPKCKKPSPCKPKCKVPCVRCA